MLPRPRRLLGLWIGSVTLSHADPGQEHPSPESRVYSRGGITWVFAAPRKSERVLGYVRAGQSVRVREQGLKPGPGCPKGFAAVEPFGWVCLDGAATFDGNERTVRTLTPFDPAPAPLPFDYALSNGAPMYRRLPSPEEWAKNERFYPPAGSHGKLSWGNRGHELLAETRPILPDAMGGKMAEGFRGAASKAAAEPILRREIPFGSMLAYRGVIEHQGRTFLFSTDGTVVPADRVRPYRVSGFRGVELGAGVELPLAWIRGKERPKYRMAPKGGLVPTGAEWSVRSHVALDPDVPVVERSGQRYWATREQERGVRHWIADLDATVVRPARPQSWGISDPEKWLLISITGGTLVAYQGARAVFATLISPGAGGVPRPGQDPVKMSTTPLGTYRIAFKHRTTTMSPEQGEHRKFWIAEVPYTQYFNAPFALHTAYWHESFGEPMSAGCINVSPLDGQWLFAWTSPLVPSDWNGAAPSAHTGPGTVVVVVR